MGDFLKYNNNVQTTLPHVAKFARQHEWYPLRLLDLSHLAIQTDSTRLITVMLAGSSVNPSIEDASLGYPDLSHFGKHPSKLAQLKILQRFTMRIVRDLLGQLRQSQEDGSTGTLTGLELSRG